MIMTSKEREILFDYIWEIERNAAKRLKAEIDSKEADHVIKNTKAKISNMIKERNKDY